MPVTVADLLGSEGLDLRLLGGDPQTPVGWVHSTDLADPTPFLEPGNLLLTTGPRLGSRGRKQDFDGYVRRLARHGVAALGFGTEVSRSGTPARLVTACAEHDLVLLEVPYATPFIAVARRVADALAEEAHARDRWTLRAQRAISLAALSRARLAAVLDELARQLPAAVVLFDPQGTPWSRHPQRGVRADLLRSLPAAETVRAEAVRLLRRGLRSGSGLEVEGRAVHVQTLGRRGELRGALAVVTDAVLDPAGRSVVTSAVALAEYALEDAGAERDRRAAWQRQLWALLLAGQAEAVAQALAVTGAGLPRPPLRVALIDPGPDGADELSRRLGARADRAGARWFAAPLADGLAVLVEDAWLPAMTGCCRDAVGAAAVGVSAGTDYDRLQPALAQARAAKDQARTAGGVAMIESDRVLGLLPYEEVAALARAQLGTLLAEEEGRNLLAVAEVWLRHNAQWDPAARDLGIHRHTVKALVRELERRLRLDLDRFDDRARLWALLVSAPAGAAVSPGSKSARAAAFGDRMVPTSPQAREEAD